MKRVAIYIGGALILFALALLLVRLTSPALVVITWETASEVDAVGFFLLRGQSPEGPFTPLTGTPVPARGDPLVGASYRYEDREVVWGRTYFYQLEEVERGGGRNRYPEVVEARAGAGWVWALVGGTGVALVWLMGSYRLLNLRPLSSDR